MMNFANNITIVIVSHKSKKKLTNLIKNISNNIKIIIVENSLDKSIEIDLSKLGKKIDLILINYLMEFICLELCFLMTL